MASYSFKDITASLAGAGLFANLGADSAAAEEGITVAPIDDKNIMTIGAGGSGIHSLRADDSAIITVRLLKSSPSNFILMGAYNFQKQSSLNWGKNTLTLRDVARGDFLVAQQVAFARVPDLEFGTEAQPVEWIFHAIKLLPILGVGTPEI
jgi:hypothetical protein